MCLKKLADQSGKLTPIYEMEVHAEVDRITRNVRYKSTDPVEDGLLVRKVPNELQDLTYEIGRHTSELQSPC